MYRSTFNKILNDFYKTNILSEAGRTTSNQNPNSNNSNELIDLNIEDILNQFGIVKIFDEVKDSGFLSEKFDKHFSKFLQSYGAGSEIVPAVYKMLYFLSGFEEDTNKVYKTYQGLSSSSFGDSIDDGNNSYFCYWFSKMLDKAEEIQHKLGVKDPIGGIVTEFEKLNPKNIKLYQVIICRLFLRRLRTFISKKYVKKRFLDLKKYPKDELYQKILHDVGLSLFDYLDMAKKYYDRGVYDAGGNQEQKLKSMALNSMGEEYSSFISLIDDKAREAIAQMLANNETNEANPTIPGNMHDRAAVDVLEKFRSDENIDIKHSYSTMATTPDGKLLIGSLFFDEEFNGGKLEPSAQEFEYFKTIVAHEALHQIFFAFDDNEILSFLPDKYAAIARQSAYRGLFHTAANIIQDCFLNGMLEDWHFKIKPEWYEKFYFPKRGLRTFKYKILSEGLDILRADPELEVYAKYERNGEITIGMASTMTTRQFPPSVISFENESECVAFLFVLMYEDMMFNSKNPSKPPEPDLKEPPPQGPPSGPPPPPSDQPPDGPPPPSDDSVSVGEICRLPDGTYGKVSNVDSDGTFDVTPITKEEVDQHLGESRIRRSGIVLLEGKYKVSDVTFITKNPPEGQEPPPPSDQPQEGKKKTEPKDKPKDPPKDDSKGKPKDNPQDSRPDDISKPKSGGDGVKSDNDDAERQRVQDYLNQMEKDNGKIMDSESHDTESSSEGDDSEDPSKEGGQGDGGKKRSETSEERKGKRFRFTPYHIKNNSYKNILKDFLAKSFKYKKTYEDTDIERVASYNAGGAVIRDEKMVPQKADPTVDSIVIAIDTSGSISADMCRSFLNQAYTILKNQAKEMKLLTPSGALVSGVKEKDLFSCIPIFWHDRAYFPVLSRDKIEDIKLNCVNFNTKIGSVMQYFDSGGTTFSSVVPKYNEIQKALGTKKIAGIIYFTDMELYEDKVKLPATPAVKIVSIINPTTQSHIYNRLKFEIPPKTKFNPYGGDIIYDPELDPSRAKSNFQESVKPSFENNFKINGRLYKDL